MTLTQMQYFSTTCETMSISIAAQLLYVSQPTLSLALAALEKEVGFQLFFRRSRGVCPTEEGLLLLEHVNAVLKRMERLQEEIPLIAKRQNVIRVGFRPYVGEDTFFYLIHAFVKGHMEAIFKIDEISTQKTYVYLEENRIDFLFANKWAIPSELDAKYECCRVGTERLQLFVSRDSPLVQKREITLEDFERFPIAFWEGHRMMIYQIQKKMAEQERVLNVTAVIPQLSGLLQYVYYDLAMAFLPGSLAGGIPSVCEVPVSQEIMEMVADGEAAYDVYAYWNKGIEKYEMKKEFVRFLKKISRRGSFI